ncbi:MAG: electron transfer flavoprotein subunit beta [Bdellovibrionales bacterium RBG_16_40_8]|nr:MAG: electron transfer flavoprotein subunit beta [Bdellovibrionales bacterium RBG_16_40_8]
MRFAVCIKQVPDTESKIKLKSDGSNIDSAGVKWVINPYDEHAIEEAIKLRDANAGSQVLVFTVGPKTRVGEALRTALAMGANEAIAIDAPDQLDSSLTAQALAAALKKEGSFDFVLTGKLAIDDNAACVSQMLAHELNIPHATVISKLTMAGSLLTVEREIEGGTKQILELTLPALISANKGLNIPRYASLPGIMKAKTKIIKDYSLADLGIDIGQMRVKYSQFKLPPEKPPVKMLDGDIAKKVHDLAMLLREEAKVI